MWSATEAFAVRPKHNKAKDDNEHMVYLIQTREMGQYKIGRTSHPRGRMSSYSRKGDPAYYVVQFIVGSREDALRLERRCISYLHRRGAVIKGSEWFWLIEQDLLGFVSDIQVNTPVPILEVRGSPGAEEAEPHWTIEEQSRFTNRLTSGERFKREWGRV